MAAVVPDQGASLAPIIRCNTPTLPGTLRWCNAKAHGALGLLSSILLLTFFSTWATN